MFVAAAAKRVQEAKNSQKGAQHIYSHLFNAVDF